MNKRWCQQCGAETWEVQGRNGPILLDPATPEAAATDRVSVRFHGSAGTIASNHAWTVHRCKQIKFPKRRSLATINATRRAVGLDPVEERGDSA